MSPTPDPDDGADDHGGDGDHGRDGPPGGGPPDADDGAGAGDDGGGPPGDDAGDPAAHGARFDRKAGDYDATAGDTYRRCADLVVARAAEAARPSDVVLDLGVGTGAVGLALAPRVARVVGRDVSEGMLDRARAKARERGLSNVDLATGRFRAPNVDGYRPPTGRDRPAAGDDGDSDGDGDGPDAATAADGPDGDDPAGPAVGGPRGSAFDVVVSNFAMHHLDDAAKRRAVEVIADLAPRRFVLGDVMSFEGPDPAAPFFDPSVDDPATVGHLADVLTEAFALTAVERVGETGQAGVLVADRPDAVPVGGRDGGDGAGPPVEAGAVPRAVLDGDGDGGDGDDGGDPAGPAVGESRDGGG